jgi:hypothetical protein
VLPLENGDTCEELIIVEGVLRVESECSVDKS